MTPISRDQHHTPDRPDHSSRSVDVGLLVEKRTKDLLLVQVTRGLLMVQVTSQIGSLSARLAVRNRIDHDHGFSRDDEIVVTIDGRFEAEAITAEGFDDGDCRGELVPQ